jgi:hypothetical protein
VAEDYERRVHVETRNQLLHAEILKLFRQMGWKPPFLYEGNIADETPWGRINFHGGTQSDQFKVGNRVTVSLSAGHAITSS